ncbi:hypothetical protein LAZ67_18001859 [Cordylochernes scorpioides]|uniref:Uncharacterized protein n=1 Tax=Cordylochernes scorpioides TaxID=51811 RepID=A0ABY6LG70_9ARAC|nr:hypothetical protein LAZ67_18001859 [Cordylochernes scorpioides]
MYGFLIYRVQTYRQTDIQFYIYRFLPNLSDLAYPLCNLLKNNVKCSWNVETHRSFNSCKKSLDETTCLSHYSPNLPLILSCDESQCPSLDPKYVENIWDIVSSESKTKFAESKVGLLNWFKESENARIKRLITGVELGNMKPSQVLQKLRAIATPDISEKLIRTLWLDKLPDSFKAILLVSDEDVNKLAAMADKITDLTTKSEIYDINHDTNKVLLDKISEIERHISQINVEHYSRRDTRQSNSARTRSRSRSNRRFNPNGKLCYYNYRFGKKCLPGKCVQPCGWEYRNTINRTPQVDQTENSNLHHCSIQTKTYYKLYAANGSEIKTFGIKILNLYLGLRRDFQWPIIIANVKRGILGADFLFKYNILVDINKSKLIDGLNNLEIICGAISTFEGSITTVKA